MSISKTSITILMVFKLVGCQSNVSENNHLVVGEPALNYTSTSGSGDLTVYGQNFNNTEILVIEASRPNLGISTTETAFKIEENSHQDLRVFLEQSSSDVEEIKRFDVCDDQRFADAPKAKRWVAIAGSVSIPISTDSPNPGSEAYKATVRLKNLTIQDPDTGVTKQIETQDFIDVVVGWFPG